MWASALLLHPRPRYKQELCRLVMHTQSLNQVGSLILSLLKCFCKRIHALLLRKTKANTKNENLGGSCAAIESDYILTFAQFLAWNPAVGSNCQSLEVGVAYCVGVSAAATTITSSSVTAVTAPGPTQTGIVANCNAWTLCESGKSPPAIRVSRKDRSLIRFLGCSCSAIESAYGLTFAQFYAWNPAIGSGCTDLELGEAYCVGV